MVYAESQDFLSSLDTDSAHAAFALSSFGVGNFYYWLAAWILVFGGTIVYLALFTYGLEAFLKNLEVAIGNNGQLVGCTVVTLFLWNIASLIAEVVQASIWQKSFPNAGVVAFFGKMMFIVLVLFSIGLVLCFIMCQGSTHLIGACVMITFLIFGYLVFISLIPTFILLLYPIKVIAILTYVVAFIYSLPILLSAIIHTFVKGNNCCTSCYHCCAPLATALSFFTIIFVLIYLLVLAKTSTVITPTVYGIISIFPSLGISLGSWYLKKRVFKTQNKTTQQLPQDGTNLQELPSHPKEQEEEDESNPLLNGRQPDYKTVDTS